MHTRCVQVGQLWALILAVLAVRVQYCTASTEQCSVGCTTSEVLLDRMARMQMHSQFAQFLPASYCCGCCCHSAVLPLWCTSNSCSSRTDNAPRPSSMRRMQHGGCSSTAHPRQRCLLTFMSALRGWWTACCSAHSTLPLVNMLLCWSHVPCMVRFWRVAAQHDWHRQAGHPQHM